MKTWSIAIATLICMTLNAVGDTLIAPDGRYRTDCDSPLEWKDSDGRLEIIGNELVFWEHACTLNNPVNIRDMTEAKIYDAVCEGEGLEWSDRVVMHSSVYQGLRSVSIISNQGGHIFQECPR